MRWCHSRRWPILRVSDELQVTVPSCDCVPAPGGVPVQVTVSEPDLGTSPVNLNYLFTYEAS